MIYLIILFALAIFAILDFFHVREKTVAGAGGKHVAEKIDDSNKIGGFKLTIFILIVLGLIAFAGFRYYVGLDYSSYSNIFYEIMDGQKVGLEPGFVFVNKIIGEHFAYPTLMFLIFAAVTVGFKSIIIKQSTNRVFFALFIAVSLYFLVGTMGQIRSTFAQAIDFIALYLYLKNKRIIPFILILISVLFHVSAIVFLLIFIVGARRYNTVVIIGLLVVCALGGHFLDIKGIGLHFKGSYGFIGDKIYAYTNIMSQKMGLSFNVLLDIFTVTFILIVRKIYNINNRKFNILFNVYLLGVISMFVFNNYFIIGIRFSNYYRLALILLIPYLMNKIHNKKVRFLFVSMFVFIYFVMNIRFLQANAVFYLPYRMNIFGYII
ncbi:EpsG family protein [uncultured Clostridium sp.]|uniref:EpsG family protein n=1 Tax=uncultured Clostridium sp. TaxID=59620 RepID=UPI002631CE9A|nr:EpsG family protein [uncultured Clostridium sp.]